MTLQLHKHGIINIFKYVQNKKGLIFVMRSNGPLTPSECDDVEQVKDHLKEKWNAK
jgi:hypothetical protein